MKTVLIKYFVISLSVLTPLFAAAQGIQSQTAQDVTRLVVLPFDASGPAEVYRAGLATALQRGLNVIDGVYVPPVGDALLVFGRLSDQNNVSAEAVAEAFGASTIVSGRVTLAGSQATVLLSFAGPAYPQPAERTLTVSADDPAALVASVLDAVVDGLGLRLSSGDRQELDAVAAQTPSLPSLGAVGTASLRLPAFDPAALAAATSLDGDSSWVLSEQARALLLSGDQAGALTTSQAAIDAAPQDIEALVTRGLILLATGDAATARQAFEAAQILNPAHALALQGLGRTAADPAAAMAAYGAALNAYPRLVEAYIDLAALEGQNDPRRALQTLRSGADRVPDSLGLKRAFIGLAIQQGDPAGALSYLQTEVQDEAARSPDLYALAAGLPGEYGTQALELVRQGRTVYPDDATLALAEASLLSQSGDAASAQSVLTDAYAKDPQNVGLANELAIAQARAGDLGAARATLEAVPGVSGGSNVALGVNLAQIYLQAGQADAAISTLEPLLTRAPDDAGLYALYGTALGRAGRYDQALNALDRALELDPDNAQAAGAQSAVEQQRSLTGGQRLAYSGETATAVNEGLSAVEAGNFAEAATAFGRASELIGETSNDGFIPFYEAYALQRTNRVREAIPLYEKALESFTNNDTVLNNLGYAYVQTGRYDRALEYLTRATEANPDNSQAQLNLGGVYYQLNRYPQAIAAWERAVALDPGLTETLNPLLEDARARVSQ